MSWELSKEEQLLKDKLSYANKIPKHIAIIMDGNGRWAKGRFMPRLKGHRAGIETVRNIVKISSEMGVKYLTLYAFSTENWKRPKDEVSGLMKLLENYLKKEIKELHKNNVILTMIGDKDKLPKSVVDILNESFELTKNNTGLNLNLALSYSGKWDIIKAVKSIANEVTQGKLRTDEINEELFANHLSTKGKSDVDLLIRTSGELRISNFLLWEIAYSEIFVTEQLWPDFNRERFCESLQWYAGRNRRFGTLIEK